MLLIPRISNVITEMLWTSKIIIFSVPVDYSCMNECLDNPIIRGFGKEIEIDLCIEI